jgi:hypothetical protein
MSDKQTRETFPVDLDGSGCPNCGMDGSIQAVEWGLKTWDLIQVESGVAQFDGHFEWTEDSKDEHISCWNCDAEWSMPEKVDYR